VTLFRLVRQVCAELFDVNLFRLSSIARYGGRSFVYYIP
jgi:hypothetical protein